MASVGSNRGAAEALDPSVVSPPDVEQIRVGSRVGDYEIVDVLGRGGMAVVYLARQVSLDRLVALKMIAAPWASDIETQERFRREARSLAQLDHPGIVSLHDAGTLQGALFYTMDYVNGPDLGRALRDRPLSVREAAALVQCIAEAVGYAHDRGVVHRDLKPGNVLLDAAGEPRVTDFGLALDGEGETGELTLTGDVLGTPPFMAPEVLAGGAARAGAPADVYSLGAILFQILTGRTPFIGGSASEILNLAINEQPPSIRLLNPSVPRDLQTICSKCLEKAAANRYVDAGELAADLQRFLADEPIHARTVSRAVRALRWSRRRPALAGLIIVLACGAIAAICAAVMINSGRQRAVHAEGEAREQLWRANFAEAQAMRQTTKAGARAGALRAIGNAARFRPSIQLRDEAIAALALDDVVTETSWNLPLDSEAAVVFEPSLESYLAETAPGLLLLRNCHDQHVIARLEVAGAKVVGVPVFSRDGRYLVARYMDKVVRVWDVNLARIAFELPERPSPMAQPTWRYGFDLAFRPDGKQLAVGSPGGGFTLHGLPGGEEQGRWPAQAPPSIVAFSPDGHRIAVVGRNLPDVHLLDAKALSEERAVKLPAVPTCVAWSPASDRVAVGTRASRIHFIAAESGEVVDTITTSESGVVGQMLFHPQRPILVGNGSDETLQFWSPATGVLLRRLEGANNRPALAFNPAGTRLAVYDAAARRAALVAIQPSAVYESVAPPAPVRSAVSTGALDLNSRWLLSSAHGAVQLRDAGTGKALQTISGASKQDMMTAQFSPNGRALFVSSQQTGLSRSGLAITPVGEPSLAAAEPLDAEPGFSIEGVAEDGRVLLISEEKQIAKVVDPANRGAAVRWPVPKITSACFSPDGRQVLTEAGEPISGEAAVKVWDLAADVPPRVTASFSDDAGGRVQCSRTGGWVLVTGDKTTRLWRFGSWQPGPQLPSELQGELHHARLSPDGASLVIEKDHEIHLLSTANGTPLATFKAPSNPGGICVNEAFSADGARLALLWQYGSVHTWDIAAMHRELAGLGLDWKP